MKAFQNTLKELLSYPSAAVGLFIVLLMIGVSAYTLIAIPYSQAIILWRGGEEIWYKLPKNVPPAWINTRSRSPI